jgi:hypothetical protein
MCFAFHFFQSLQGHRLKFTAIIFPVGIPLCYVMKSQLKKTIGVGFVSTGVFIMSHTAMYLQIRILDSNVKIYMGQAKMIFSTRFKEHIKGRSKQD